MGYFIEAEAKIKNGISAAKAEGRQAAVVTEPTAEALISFCKQSDEFAQAVVQGGSFAECIKSCCKGIGGAISDIDFYRKAVQFYFKGAVIDFVMNIRMSEYEKKTDNIISLNLTDFM